MQDPDSQSNNQITIQDMARTMAISNVRSIHEIHIPSLDILLDDLLYIFNSKDIFETAEWITNSKEIVHFDAQTQKFYPYTETSISRSFLKSLVNISGNLNNSNQFTVYFKTYKIDIENVPTAIASEIVMYADYSYKETLDLFVSEINKEQYLEELEEERFFYAVNIDSRNGLFLKEEEIPEIVLDLTANYGKEFVTVLDSFIEKLKERKSGISVLHGEQGTGKKHIVKMIIKLLNEDKNIIYMPSYLLADMANSDFISFLRNHPDSILILEDAEDYLRRRDDNNSNIIVSNIINLTTGIMADNLRMQILITCNIDKKVLDKQLLRPGSLMFDHKFSKLKAEDATKLSKQIGIDKEWTVGATLAEIYANDPDATKKTKKKRVGFNSEEDN